jgi:Xaa-Pro aminopeptidase
MTPEIYKQRREKLQEDLYIFTAHTSLQSRGDASFPFVQEASFLYLTGIDEPDWQLIIDTGANKTYLVAPFIDEVHQLFDGGLPVEEAMRMSGVDAVIKHDEYKALFEELSKKCDTVHTLKEHPATAHYDFAVNPAQEKLQSNLSHYFKTIEDCRKELSKSRAIKSGEEIDAIKQAVNITVKGFNRIKEELSQTKYEYEIEATLNDVFRRHGSGGHAYSPIVAAGKNACTLHYDKNNNELPVNGLVLIDAATQVNGYAADITRTYAVGTPSERERAVHKAVEESHKEIIQLIKPGLSLKEYQEEVDRIMKQALEGLGLLKTPEDYRTYFPHAVGHGLGIDVHDSLGGYENLQPGMVLTVEPGIYIPEEGIGVRIEDDILVTNDGNENLSQALPISL